MTLASRLRRLVPAAAALVLSVAGVARGQGAATISGRVATSDGVPLPGANVVIPELAISVGTNEAGRYTITIPAARVRGQVVAVTARAIGYKPLRKNATVSASAQSLDFGLEKDVNQLSQVVVTGTTEATEARKVPFVVDQVSARNMPVAGANPISQLQGKVPGANIVSASGRPGATPSVILRGPTSINATGRGQSPLYIIDGVQLQGGLPDINPSDIENVEVVKGAAAASLYGARAGNGVINITTKNGRTGSEGVKFNVSSEYGASDIERDFPLAQRTSIQFSENQQMYCARDAASEAARCGRLIDMDTERRRINDVPDVFTLSPQLFKQDFGIAAAPTQNDLRNVYQINKFPKTYNAIDQVVTPSAFANTNVDMSGRMNKSNFFVSAGNLTQQGAIRYLSGFKRNSVRANFDQALGDKWNVNLRTTYARTIQDGLAQSGGENGNTQGFFRLTRVPAFADLLEKDSQGRLLVRTNPLNQGSQNENPLQSIRGWNRTDERDRFIGGLAVKFSPLTWLDTDGQFSYDRTNSSFFFLEDRGYRTTSNSPVDNLGNTERYSATDMSYNSTLNARARREWTRDLRTTLSARYSYEQQDFTDRDLYGEQLAVAGLETARNATTNFSINGTGSSIRSIGMFGGLDVDFMDRYNFSGVLRRDGSSLFGRENRWANFYRAAFAWNISDEPWWFASRVISDMKLRIAHGTTGNRPNFSAQYETYTIGTGGTLNPNTLGNSQLKPEVIEETETGADFELFRRFGVKITYAASDAKNQILLVPSFAASGFANQWRNAGTLNNKTWEAALTIPVLERRDLSWTTGLVYDRNRAVIKRLDVPPYFSGPSLQAADLVFLFKEGERLGTFYGRGFVTSCDQLPTTPTNFQAQCGGAGSQFQKNSDGFIVWTGGENLGDGIKKNLWNAVLNAANAPWSTRATWGMPILQRDSVNNPKSINLGHATPDYHFAVNNNVTWKRVTLYGLLDANIGQSVWNQGFHWSLGDFMDRIEDQTGKSVEDAKPIGYYWRAGPGLGGNNAGTGGFYDILGPSNVSVMKASYAKLREVSLSYRVGRVAGVGDWTLGLVGRNLMTFTDYVGFDPEVGISNTGTTGGPLASGALNAIDRYGFPNLRTFTLQLRSSF